MTKKLVVNFFVPKEISTPPTFMNCLSYEDEVGMFVNDDEESETDEDIDISKNILLLVIGCSSFLFCKMSNIRTNI